MKITWAYLRRAVFWTVSVYVAAALTIAIVVIVVIGIDWVAGANTPLYWGLLAGFIFLFLLLIYVGSDWAVEIMWRRHDRSNP